MCIRDSGNVPGAICAATASNLLGTVLTPLLVAVLLHRQGGGHGLADACLLYTSRCV